MKPCIVYLSPSGKQPFSLSSHLCVISRLEQATRVYRCIVQGTKVEACLTAPYRPWGVSNTKAICPLVLGARRPRLRRGLLQQRRV